MKTLYTSFVFTFIIHILSFGQNFSFNSNGILVCTNASVGETSTIDGVTYTKIDSKNSLQIHGGSVSADEACISGVTDLEQWFYQKDFNKDIGHWDVSSVTRMYALFSYSSFNQDIGKWDVSNVTSMNSLFNAATSFNQDISSWDVSNVYDMAYMFEKARAFDQPIGSWNVSNVTKMQGMFQDARMFNQPIGNWDVSKVRNMSMMFKRSNFNQSIGDWNTGSVTTMYQMFFENQVFNQPIGSWDVSNVTNMQQMFQGVQVRIDEYTNDGLVGSQFNQDIGNWDVSSVTTMEDMFREAHMFNQDISSWDVSSVTTFQGMFYKGFNFNHGIDTWNVSNITDFRYMFVYAIDFNQSLSNWDVSNATMMTAMFDMAWNYSQDLSMWCVTNISTEPTNFRRDTPLTDQQMPNWGALCSLSSVSLTSPSNSSSNVSLTPTLSWTENTDATSYDVQVSTNNFSSNVINTNTASTSYTTSELSYSTTYQWRVRAKTSELTSDWSQTFTFTTEDAPIIPVSKVVLTSPSNQSTGIGLSPTLSWESDANANSYTIQVSTDNFSTFVKNQSITSTSTTLSSLSYTTTYSWRVKASNEAGDGEWSDVWSFTTEDEPVPPPSKATLTTPRNNATQIPPSLTLSWDTLDDASSYIVQVSTNGFSTYIVNETTSITSHDIEVNTNTTYQWRVRGVNSGGNGSWSDVWSFTTREDLIDPAQIVSPKQMAKGVQTTPKFIWKKVNRATLYDVRLYRKNTGELIYEGSTNDTTFTINGLDYETEYIYKVKAKNSNVESEWSEVQFTTTGMTTSNEGNDIPNDFELGQNYPNPFNPTTSINYSLPQSSYVLLEVYDMMGQKISTLVDGVKSPGTHTTTFDATDLSSGTYIYRITTNGFSETKKMFLIK